MITRFRALLPRLCLRHANHGRGPISRLHSVPPVTLAPPRRSVSTDSQTPQPKHTGRDDGGREGRDGVIDSADSEPPLPELMRWYSDVRRRQKIPTLRKLISLMGEAERQGQLQYWEAIVRDDIPGYLDRMAPKARQRFSGAIWSIAIRGYARKKDAQSALDYFGRIVRAGAYPAPSACAVLIHMFRSMEPPIPVIPKGWSGSAAPICGMDPIYPPQSTSLSAQHIKPTKPHHHKVLVAEMALAMFYALLWHKTVPSTSFLFALELSLDQARMKDQLEHIYETVLPKLRQEPWHK